MTPKTEKALFQQLIASYKNWPSYESMKLIGSLKFASSNADKLVYFIRAFISFAELYSRRQLIYLDDRRFIIKS